jgi:LuxR family maltose regulon positive regulatory protein
VGSQCLEREGLFCLTLDARQEWYRYHHLFQDLLQRQLEARLSPNEIANLHGRAAAWLDEHGLLEEAIHHALVGDGPAEASRLMVSHRNDILNGEQWHRLERWLRWLPTETVEDDPELLMLKTWHLLNEGRHVDVYSHLDRIEERLSSEFDAERAGHVRMLMEL